MIYIVILYRDATDSFKSRINKEYPKNHKYTDNTFLLEDPTLTEGSIAFRLGVKGVNITSSGGVFGLHEPNFSGHTLTALLDWFRRMEK